MRYAAVLLATLLVACLHRPPPPMHVEHLTVERSADGDLRPYVRVWVDGEPLMMLVDTGAFGSILPTNFARRHRLGVTGTQADGYLVDANGYMRKVNGASRAPVRFEGEQAAGKMDFNVVPSVEITEGILAVQDIVRPGSVLIIDLGREEIRSEDEQAALARLRANTAEPLREVDFRRCLSEGLFERNHRSVPATINGVATRMMIDTGATRTTMARNNPALRSMVERKGSIGNTNGIISTGKTLMVPDVPLDVAGTSFVLPMLVEPASQGCADGLIGADVLSHCTLVWGWSSMWMACRANEGATQKPAAPKK